jgi:tRNA C32,U32 (ribose-2'-O)-methylase TrmJ
LLLLRTILLTFLSSPVDPSNPSNVFACLRTLDAFGIQNVDIIIQSNQYRGKAAIYQKRNMRTAMGSAKWLTVTNYETTEEAVRTMKEQYNCRIYASDLSPLSVDIRNMDWTRLATKDLPEQIIASQPICIVMGNEDAGISDTMRALVDATFTLPMVGFAESFNLSVATAIVLAHLSAASTIYTEKPDESSVSTRKWTGPLQPGDLSSHEYSCLYLKGLIYSLPQRRMALPLLRQAGIELPKELNVA